MSMTNDSMSCVRRGRFQDRSGARRMQGDMRADGEGEEARLGGVARRT
ncbi:hypothetical protein BURPS1710A_A0458 [Burkholderia pseudomallei 1710a]|uniref:Uncharacterized protein n=1 Tax=Burkholderia pseudomallei 1710a TaxID=320371 RepID=A0A0E1VWX9_BURPE|nr:hypothetical protein BURPS1655_I0596 [Burkholderia pseudomallei 1655]EET04674.1 hypothetical protein BURPS1710A_A0458 [Burkholderia pseudomallei 1710a]